METEILNNTTFLRVQFQQSLFVVQKVKLACKSIQSIFFQFPNLCSFFTRGVPLGGNGGLVPPPLYPTSISEGPTISISNTRDIAFYWCSKIILTRNLAIFTMYATSLEQFLAVFHFSNYIQIDHFKLDLLKNVRQLTLDLLNIFSLWTIRKKTAMNESLTIGGILDQLEQSSKTREASFKWSTIKYNSINT